MRKCASCGSELGESNRFCPSCGEKLSAEVFATQTVGAVRPMTPRTPGGGGSPLVRTSSSSRSESRFPPGTLLAGRYRIIALLGRGGMGEVYRADDLTLEQGVALKFLPESVAGNESALARFRNEVRVARQVSHPNVCRVYDFGEIEGQAFLSMEYVDGEDLASLLRRIGRLPADKGVEIARKLCAGLAAAHEKGVLHRDLKPSNVMLDSRGQVLLTDFGLAGLAEQMSGAEARNGTPAYMAPEQLSGKEVTVQSDIYALGLVLYEIFTGRRPFEANSLAELTRAQTESTPISLTSLVRDLDPAVERVILRCLDPNPARRPPSALAVAAALPGGDPLAAALAAGETPTPKMVAAAGQGLGLQPGVAVGLLALVVFFLAAYYALEVRRSALERIGASYSPEILSLKAQDLIRTLGFSEKVADQAYGFDWDQSFIDYAESHDKPAPNWDKVMAERPMALHFWYRQSPYPLTALSYHSDLLTPGVVDPTDPPPIQSGMIAVQLDPQGRLRYLERIPEQQQKPAANASTPMDWRPLFTAAGLDPSQFQSTEPLRTWLATADTRAAWTGSWPGSNRPLRVEAAALRGQAVAFSLIGPWTTPDRMPKDSTEGERIQLVGVAVLLFIVLFGGGWLARRNMRQGRGDRVGARRLAIWIAGAEMALWMCGSHFNASTGTFAMFILAICTAVFYGCAVYALYIALEPQVRRRWPHTLISWTAVLTGQWRDPIVGRDVLVGTALGIGFPVFGNAVNAALGSNVPPRLGSTDVLLGFRSTLAIGLQSMPHGIRDTLIFALLLFLLRAILRNQWVAMAAFGIIFTLQTSIGSSHFIVDGLEQLVVYMLVAAAAWRFGLLALAVFILSNNTVGNMQATLHAGAWYLGNSLFLIACGLALAVWGCYTSIGGQKFWKSDLFES